MRYTDLFEYRSDTEMWINPQGKLHYDLHPTTEEGDSYINHGWIWVKAEPDGSLSARHQYATRYAYARLKMLIQQHEKAVHSEN